MNPEVQISVVIPIFRGEDLLPELLHRLKVVISAQPEQWEVIIVNDSGRIDAWEKIENLVSQNDSCTAIDLTRNYGQHAAVLCGVRAARGNTVVTIDEDLEQPPEAIPTLLAQLTKEYDVVYGSPLKRHQKLHRKLPSLLLRAVLKYLFNLEIALRATSFRAFRTSLRRGFEDLKSSAVSIDALLTLTTRRFTFVEVEFEEPKISGSGYGLKSLLLYAFDLISGFSAAPLRFASLLGLIFTLFGLGTFGWVVGRYLIIGGSVPGFPFVASIISIFSGAQLFALGVMGEYIARIHFRTMPSPPFVIRQIRHGMGQSGEDRGEVGSISERVGDLSSSALR